MKRLNAKGFAHQVVLLAVLVVLAIGGIGSYIYLNSSSAATDSASKIYPNNWGLRGAAKLEKDKQKGTVVKLPLQKQAKKTGSINTAKLQDFFLKNAGKKVKVCIDAKGSTGNSNVGINFSVYGGPAKNINLSKLWHSYCFTGKISNDIAKFAAAGHVSISRYGAYGTDAFIGKTTVQGL
ncbi:hypothetical protein BH09PAT4_BH09PAT4_00580 [soil metagenome]